MDSVALEYALIFFNIIIFLHCISRPKYFSSKILVWYTPKIYIHRYIHYPLWDRIKIYFKLLDYNFPVIIRRFVYIILTAAQQKYKPILALEVDMKLK
jgi:hypothetical protein